MKCFFHSSDLDGQCSGAIIKMAYPDCELIGINYGDDFPWDSIKRNDTVILVDISLQPFSDMEKLSNMCSLYWIDHHISAINEYEKSKNFRPADVSLNTEYAACELTWKYFNKTSIPYYVTLLGQFDIWNHSNPDTLFFQYGLSQYNTNPDNQILWEKLKLKQFLTEIINEGRHIKKYVDKENIKYLKNAGFETEFSGYKCYAVNKLFCGSLIFDSLKNKEDYDIFIIFGYNNFKWSISLYSEKDNIDVSKLAKKYGGGGHKGASGFQLKEKPVFIK